MKIEIVYKGDRPHIFFDDEEVRGVESYSVSQSVSADGMQKLHLDIFAFEGIKIEYAEEKK